MLSPLEVLTSATVYFVCWQSFAFGFACWSAGVARTSRYKDDLDLNIFCTYEYVLDRDVQRSDVASCISFSACECECLCFVETGNPTFKHSIEIPEHNAHANRKHSDGRFVRVFQ